MLTTAASMIACVNGFLGGAGIALLIYHLVWPSIALSVIAGAAFVVARIAIACVYQMWRIGILERLAKERSFLTEDGTG